MTLWTSQFSGIKKIHLEGPLNTKIQSKLRMELEDLGAFKEIRVDLSKAQASPEERARLQRELAEKSGGRVKF